MSVSGGLPSPETRQDVYAFDEVAAGEQATVSNRPSEDRIIVGVQCAVEMNVPGSGQNDWKLHAQVGPTDKIVDLSGALGGAGGGAHQVFENEDFFLRYQGHAMAEGGQIGGNVYNPFFVPRPELGWHWPNDSTLNVQFRVGSASSNALTMLFSIFYQEA